MEIGEIFEGMYPPEAAVWCRDNGAKIIEIESQGTRRFQIVSAEPTEEEKRAKEIYVLKHFLADTDYVVIKIAEGVATPEDYAEVIAQRQSARARIRELEA
jgi:hypothetical protein